MITGVKSAITQLERCGDLERDSCTVDELLGGQ